MTDLPPSSPPPPFPAQPSPMLHDPNQSSLNTLSIFYFIYAGLQVLAGCIPIVYVLLGVLFGVAGMAGARDAGDATVAAGFSGFMVCFGVGIMVLVWIFAYLNYLAGRGLRERKRLTVCYVMAVLACFQIPLGTILGIFTFVVLSKPGVKESFR